MPVGAETTMTLNSDTSTPPAQGHVALDPDPTHDPHATRFGKFLQACIKLGASDLLVKTGKAPVVRLRGALKTLDTDPVTYEEYLGIVKHILTDVQIADLHKFGSDVLDDEIGRAHV